MAELRAGPGQDKVAGRGQDAARAERRPRHDGHDGPVQLGEVVEKLLEGFHHQVGAVPEVVAQLEAGGEVLPRRGQHHQLHVPLVVERFQRGVELVHEVDRQHVGRRSVQRDADDPLASADLQESRRRRSGGVAFEVLRVLGVVGHLRPFRARGVNPRALFKLGGLSGPPRPPVTSRRTPPPCPCRRSRTASPARAERGAGPSHGAGSRPGAPRSRRWGVRARSPPR